MSVLLATQVGLLFVLWSPVRITWSLCRVHNLLSRFNPKRILEYTIICTVQLRNVPRVWCEHCDLHHEVPTHITEMLTFIKDTTQQTQNICITFMQCWTNVEDVWPRLYKCYTNVLLYRVWPITYISVDCSHTNTKHTRFHKGQNN